MRRSACRSISCRRSSISVRTSCARPFSTVSGSASIRRGNGCRSPSRSRASSRSPAASRNFDAVAHGAAPSAGAKLYGGQGPCRRTTARGAPLSRSTACPEAVDVVARDEVGRAAGAAARTRRGAGRVAGVLGERCVELRRKRLGAGRVAQAGTACSQRPGRLGGARAVGRATCSADLDAAAHVFEPLLELAAPVARPQLERVACPREAAAEASRQHRSFADASASTTRACARTPPPPARSRRVTSHDGAGPPCPMRVERRLSMPGTSGSGRGTRHKGVEIEHLPRLLLQLLERADRREQDAQADVDEIDVGDRRA